MRKKKIINRTSVQGTGIGEQKTAAMKITGSTGRRCILPMKFGGVEFQGRSKAKFLQRSDSGDKKKYEEKK